MSAVAECRAELVQAYTAIPGDPGVTAQRALHQAEEALANYENQVLLLQFEKERCERVAAQRAAREQQARESRAAFEAEAARVERKGQKRNGR